jgi:hypothetical protein
MKSLSGNAVLRDVEGKVIDRLAVLIKRQPMNSQLNQLNQQLQLVYPVPYRTDRDVHLISTAQVQIAKKSSWAINHDNVGWISNRSRLCSVGNSFHTDKAKHRN